MTSAYSSSTDHRRIARPVGPRSAGDGDRDDLLGEHVERVARHDGRLDQPFAHAAGDDGALEQVAAELGEDAPAADLADAVAGAPDALQPAGDGLGRLDLQDEVDGAHVDAELERAGGDEAGQLAGLRAAPRPSCAPRARASRGGRGDLGESAAPLAADGPWRPPRGELVQAQRDPLGRAAVVDEHDRGVVLAHEPQQLGVDRRPDRAARGLAPGDRLQRVARGPPSTGGSRAPGSAIDSTGTSIRRSSCLRAPASTIVTSRCGPTRKRPISSSGRCVALRPIRWTVARPVPPDARLRLEALEREREVRAALGVRRRRGSRRRSPPRRPLSISRAREVSIR